MLRALDDFLWALRRAGLPVAVPQAIDAARALALVGLDDRSVVREALACVVVTRQSDRERYDVIFDRFFAHGAAHARDLRAKMRLRGFDEGAIETMHALLAAMVESGGWEGDAALFASLVSSEAGLRRSLLDARIGRLLQAPTAIAQVGFFTQRVLSRVGMARATQALRPLRHALVGALGEAQGQAMADALAQELSIAGAEVRAFVAERLGQTPAETSANSRVRRLRDVPFASLNESEMNDMRRAVRVLGERLRGAVRSRERKARRGTRVDARATVRAAMKTGGVPVAIVRRARRHEKAKLWVLCDISDSVRTAATFMLELVAVLHDLFARTRAFVFVSDVAEVTQLFEQHTASRAIAEAYSGSLVPVTHNSNYGRVLRTFARRHAHEINRRATVVIVGDGRTNYQPAAADIVEGLRSRARAVLWLCPEPRETWATGDSAMRVYAQHVTAVLGAATAGELEGAARAMLRVR